MTKASNEVTSASARRISGKHGGNSNYVQHTAPPFQVQHFRLSLHAPLYSTQVIENDVSARLSNITSASCDLDLWPPDLGGRPSLRYLSPDKKRNTQKIEYLTKHLLCLTNKNERQKQHVTERYLGITCTYGYLDNTWQFSFEILATICSRPYVEA